jgi:hypothetical protein
MAQNQAVSGLLADLGLGPQDENAALQKGLGPLPGNDLAQVFGNLGRNIGSGAAGLLSAAQQRDNGDGFLKNARAGVQQAKDTFIARGLGLPGGAEELQQKRQTRRDIDALTLSSSDDPIADQMDALTQIIGVANKNGDSGLLMSALQKQVQLQKESQEFKKLQSSQRAADREERREIETDSTGRTVIMQGDDIDDAHSKAVMNDDGTWTVVRPDGTTLEGVNGIELTFVDPAAKAKQRDRFFETPEGALKNALAVNGLGGQQVDKKRGFIADMADQARVVEDMTNSLLDMFNPAVAFSDSATAAQGADRVFSLVETVSSLFDRGTPQDVTYNGQKVPPNVQFNKATDNDQYVKFLAAQGLALRDVLPSHIQSDSEESQLFAANIMQLAYLDARLQEPSNRGLSDSDIQNALKRIGAGAPNPQVFARRQLTNITRLKAKMDNLGIELAPTTQVNKAQLINHVYTPESRQQINDTLDRVVGGLNNFTSGGGSTGDEDLDFVNGLFQ